MTGRIQASVPGKVILMGEHAAVYGKPAVVAALGKRVTVDVSPSTSGVDLDLRALGYRKRCSWGDLLAYRDRKLEAWTEFQSGRSTGFQTVRGDDPAHVVKIALGEVAREVVGTDETGLPPLTVAVDSELPCVMCAPISSSRS
jgi:mevalonate kinase